MLDLSFVLIGNDIGAWTPLVWACYKGHQKVVETLIRHGADVNSRGVHHVSGYFPKCIICSHAIENII